MNEKLTYKEMINTTQTMILSTREHVFDKHIPWDDETDEAVGLSAYIEFIESTLQQMRELREGEMWDFVVHCVKLGVAAQSMLLRISTVTDRGTWEKITEKDQNPFGREEDDDGSGEG